jgi:DNA-binding CsgD family transcriptional regulator
MACSTDAPQSAAGALPGYRGDQGWRIPAPRTPEPGAPSPADRLTDRDRELVRHLADGRSTAQIAAAMSVSSNTARTRIRRVSGKLSVAGRHEIVAAARVLGLV